MNQSVISLGYSNELLTCGMISSVVCCSLLQGRKITTIETGENQRGIHSLSQDSTFTIATPAK